MMGTQSTQEAPGGALVHVVHDRGELLDEVALGPEHLKQAALDGGEVLHVAWTHDLHR